MLYIDLWPGWAVKVGSAPVWMTGASGRGISGYYSLDCGRVEWVQNCGTPVRVGAELLCNSVHRKFNQLVIRSVGGLTRWRSDQLEKRCWIEEHFPERLSPQAPGWVAQENGKETRLWPIEWGSICCCSVWSPNPSHTQPFQIKWEVYFSKNCVARLNSVIVMILHADVYVLSGYTTKIAASN